MLRPRPLPSGFVPPLRPTLAAAPRRKAATGCTRSSTTGSVRSCTSGPQNRAGKPAPVLPATAQKSLSAVVASFDGEFDEAHGVVGYGLQLRIGRRVVAGRQPGLGPAFRKQH